MYHRLTAGFFALMLMLVSGAGHALAQERPVILIGIDGFRADYLQRGVTPTLSRLAEEGATAPDGMRPSFPSVTFPNFYTLATGLHPDHHGLINNTMQDPELPGRTFSLGNRAEVMDGVWYAEGEPIWVTAENAGIRSATMFWPGSEAAIRGVRPSYWVPFEQSVPSNARVNIVLGWMTLPPEERPGLVTLYFDVVDTAGHRFGPDSVEVNETLAQVDAAVALLLEGLATRGIEADLVIVADHGMAAIDASRIVYLDDEVDPAAIRTFALGPVATLDPVPGREAEVAAALTASTPHMTCAPKGELPERLAFGTHRRIPAIVCLAETGWYIGTRERTDPERVRGGAHGYDPDDPAMRALFIAWGPSFTAGDTVTGMESVDVQPLLARMLGLIVPVGDGRRVRLTLSATAEP